MAKQRNAGPGTSSGIGSDSTTTAAGGAGQGGVVDQAKDAAGQLASQAREQTTQRVQSGLTQGKTRAASSLGAVAQTLRQSTQQLHDQNQAGAGQYIEQAANQVQRLADYLQHTDVHGIVDNVERVARRQPALFLGGTFALGLLGARFFKNSRREYRQQSGGSNYLDAGGYAGASGAAYGGASGGGYGRTSSGNAYGGASSLDRNVTSARESASDLPGAGSTAGFGGTAGTMGGTGATGSAGRSGLGSSAGGALGRSGGTGLGGSSLDLGDADRR